MSYISLPERSDDGMLLLQRQLLFVLSFSYFFGYFGLVSHHVMNSLNTALNQLLFRKIYDTNSVCTVTAIQSK